LTTSSIFLGTTLISKSLTLTGSFVPCPSLAKAMTFSGEKFISPASLVSTIILNRVILSAFMPPGIPPTKEMVLPSGEREGV